MYKYTNFRDVPTSLPMDVFQMEMDIVREYEAESRFLFRLAEAESYARDWRVRVARGWKASACFCEETAVEYVVGSLEFISKDPETRTAEMNLIAELKQKFSGIKWDYDPLDAGF